MIPAFSYTPAQADAVLAALPFTPWHHYARRAGSTLDEFEIDQQGTHAGTATHDDCVGQWSIVLITKCEIEARVQSPHAWRDHRLRMIRACGIPY